MELYVVTMSHAFGTKWPLLTIVVASNNAGKIKELYALLSDLPVEWLSISDLIGRPWSVDETGDTFEQNAVLKAQAASQATRFVALADDSGLEVDALSGSPGVRSARFAHEHASDDENNAQLLHALEQVEDPNRTARFRCVLALVSPYEPAPILAHGQCEGWIAREPEGQSGFGYDPLFRVRCLGGRSMAALSSTEKGEVSHRGQAVRQLRAPLSELLTRMASHTR
jgi:XTP/dITP diphosphohydrolase